VRGKATNIADGEIYQRTERARLVLQTGAVCCERFAEVEREERTGVQCLVWLDTASRMCRMAYGWRW
jgi:hypothetical protein